MTVDEMYRELGKIRKQHGKQQLIVSAAYYKNKFDEYEIVIPDPSQTDKTEVYLKLK